MRNSAILDRTFAALANPTRRAILAKLAENTATVNQLAEPFDMSLPAISQHVKVLEKAGLIVRGRKAQFRPCALDPGGLKMAASWTDQCRRTWEARFNQMDTLLKEIKETGNVE